MEDEGRRAVTTRAALGPNPVGRAIAVKLRISFRQRHQPVVALVVLDDPVVTLGREHELVAGSDAS